VASRRARLAAVRWVALVRNVMLGREGLRRDDLLRMVDDAGGRDARSHLTTGNVTFTAEASDAPCVARRLEPAVERVIGRLEVVVIREVGWLQRLVRSDPFAGFDPGEWELEVALLAHDAPPLGASLVCDPQRTVVVEVRDREVLAARPRGGDRRPHVNRLVEQAAGLPATSRSWSTLRHIAERE
jgi:uncharacterized protein (DUF1697 family)